jgi:hypothetical protein
MLFSVIACVIVPVSLGDFQGLVLRVSVTVDRCDLFRKVIEDLLTVLEHFLLLVLVDRSNLIELLSEVVAGKGFVGKSL